jgi:hypothetical protein
LIRPSDREGPESSFNENGGEALMRLRPSTIETVTIAAVSAMRVKEG